MKIFILLLFVVTKIALAQSDIDEAKKVPLNKSILFDEEQFSKDVVFKNIYSVQKKIIDRNKIYNIDAHLNFDYSDSLRNTNSIVLGFGYSLNNNLEFGINLINYISSNTKKIIQDIQGQGQTETISSMPKFGIGGYLNYTFSYGKETFFLKTIQNDTFVKVFFNTIKNKDERDTTQFGIGIGKNYFLSKNFSFRTAISYHHQNIIINSNTVSTSGVLIEPGVIYYY